MNRSQQRLQDNDTMEDRILQKKQLIDCALGKLEADLIISNVNVFHFD